MNDSEGKLPREIEDTFEGYFVARDFVNSAPKMSRDEFEDVLMEKILTVHGGDILQLSTHDILAANTTFKFFLNRWLKNQIHGVEVDVLNTIEDQAEQTIDPDGLIVANRHVIELSLRGLSLSSLPITFGGLSHLIKLDLANNKLTDLPDSFRLLTQLIEVNLIANPFSEFPELLNDLPSLHTVNQRNYPSTTDYLSGDNLENHVTYTHLNEIKGLRCHPKYITYDGITRSYPNISLSGLASYPKIESFLLADLEIQQLTALDVLRQCKHLMYLGLPSNRLKSFKMDELAYLSNLINLDLQSNLLTNLDLSPLKHISSLRSIYLGCNKLSSLDLTPLHSHLNLSNICINANPIEKIDISPLFSCPKLCNIDLSSSLSFSFDHPLYDALMKKEWVPIIQKVIFPSSIALNLFRNKSLIKIICSPDSILDFDSALFYISHETDKIKLLKLLID